MSPSYIILASNFIIWSIDVVKDNPFMLGTIDEDEDANGDAQFEE